jgi:hypothetical protein
MQIIGAGNLPGTAGIDYDKIVVSDTGGMGYGGALSIDFANLVAFEQDSIFDLFQFTGSPTGGFSSVVSTGTSTYGGLTFSGVSGVWTALAGSQQLTFSEQTGKLQLTAAVPEPSSWTMVLVGVGYACCMSRRRKRA